MDELTLAMLKNWTEDEFGGVRPLLPHVTEILDSRIVDHNLDVVDPPTGYYVRYECGKQECWRLVDVDLGDETEQRFSFPVGFNRLPSVGVGWERGISGGPEYSPKADTIIETVYSAENTRWLVRVRNSRISTGIQAMFFATGRWR